MAKYLQHANGDAVLCWFSPEAVLEANQMAWDDAMQQPVSQEEGLDLKADLVLLDFEWCALPPATPGTMMAMSVVNMDILSLPSFQMAGPPPLSMLAGPVMQVASTLQSNHSMVLMILLLLCQLILIFPPWNLVGNRFYKNWSYFLLWVSLTLPMEAGLPQPLLNLPTQV